MIETLLLTGVYDFSADLVALQLEESGVSFVRLNREQLADYRLTLDPTGPTLTIRKENVHVVIDRSLRSVWFRQPVFLRNTPPDPLSLTEQLERSQWSAFIRALCVFDSAAWMNWPPHVYLAESKPYQLMVAGRCGLQSPSTLVGNDSGAFARKYSRAIALKSLDTVLIREGSDCLFTYTFRHQPSELSDSEVALAPLLAQEYVMEKTDCRVTIVGTEVLAVRILSRGRPVCGDWRLTPKEALYYEEFQLPAHVERSCVALLQMLGLSYGAIDLVETSSGFLFLEINPTGEWGFLWSEKRRLDTAIARWLAAPPSRA